MTEHAVFYSFISNHKGCDRSWVGEKNEITYLYAGEHGIEACSGTESEAVKQTEGYWINRKK